MNKTWPACWSSWFILMYNKYMKNQQYKKVNHIGNKLKELLTKNNLSVDDLSKATSIHRSLLYRYISEYKNPSEKTLEIIANYFEVPKEYLTGTFSVYNKNIFIYISNIRNDLFYTSNPNNVKNLNKKRFVQSKNKYNDYYLQLPNYYRFDFMKDFYEIVLTGLFMYMSGNKFAYEAEIIPCERHHIPHRLKLAIKASSLTVQEVSNISEINRSLLQNYLAGRKNPSNENLEKITSALKLPKDFFTANWNSVVYELGDSYIYSPLPKYEKEINPTNFNEQTNRNIDNVYSDYWKIIDKIFIKLSQESKEQIIKFLDESFSKLK